MAGDAAARGPRGARTPPEPDRRPDRIHAPLGDSRLRVLREGVFRACPGRNDQSSFGGDPGGILPWRCAPSSRDHEGGLIPAATTSETNRVTVTAPMRGPELDARQRPSV